MRPIDIPRFVEYDRQESAAIDTDSLYSANGVRLVPMPIARVAMMRRLVHWARMGLFDRRLRRAAAENEDKSAEPKGQKACDRSLHHLSGLPLHNKG
jgi:hypothetical protein